MLHAKTLVLAGILVLSAGATGCAASAPETKPTALLQRTLEVSGTGQKSAPPDVFTLVFGAQFKDSSAAVAREKTRKVMETLLNEVKAHGIPEKDYETSSLTLARVHDRYGELTENIQFISNQTLTLRLPALMQAEAFLNKAIELGVNDIGQIEMGLKDRKSLQMEARQMAIRQAKERAELLAKELGMHVGNAITIRDDSNGGGGGGATIFSGEAMPRALAAGECRVNVSVAVTFELLP